QSRRGNTLTQLLWAGSCPPRSAPAPAHPPPAAARAAPGARRTGLARGAAAAGPALDLAASRGTGPLARANVRLGARGRALVHAYTGSHAFSPVDPYALPFVDADVDTAATTAAEAPAVVVGTVLVRPAVHARDRVDALRRDAAAGTQRGRERAGRCRKRAHANPGQGREHQRS